MSRVDFYVLRDSGEIARQRFACRLAEKAYSLDNAVHIRVPDQQTADRLDELLWTFKDGSFVPHEQLAGADPRSPVTIGHGDDATRQCDLLINLTEAIPDDADAFPRVAEIVTSDEPSRVSSRTRFVAYRDGGHTLDSHNI